MASASSECSGRLAETESEYEHILTLVSNDPDIWLGSRCCVFALRPKQGRVAGAGRRRRARSQARRHSGDTRCRVASNRFPGRSKAGIQPRTGFRSDECGGINCSTSPMPTQDEGPTLISHWTPRWTTEISADGCQLSRPGRRERQTVLEGPGWSLCESSEWAGPPYVGVARSLPILGPPSKSANRPHVLWNRHGHTIRTACFGLLDPKQVSVLRFINHPRRSERFTVRRYNPFCANAQLTLTPIDCYFLHPGKLSPSERCSILRTAVANFSWSSLNLPL
jgi:hypothetical protein